MDSNGIERSWMVHQIQHRWRITKQYGQQAGMMTLVMSESAFFEKISAYVAENKRKAALEAELSSTKIDTVPIKEGITELEIRTSFELPEDTVPVEEIIREEPSVIPQNLPFFVRLQRLRAQWLNSSHSLLIKGSN